MGYHTASIRKGTLGEYSKIQEEFQELEDAHEQGCKVLEICELCDILGAIDLYARNKFNLDISDLLEMSKKTAESFNEGKR